ncbi:helix-turn-helix transcriptional regulator [Microbacterium phosphatis]|uniref:helix-turn-helix transcriptional regulator n=1 Tax=Microbacterium phosphatis TaxID=3140248 RepID=UPI003140124D
MEEYLSADEVTGLIPGMTKSNLAQLRFKGQGPKFLRPTPRTIVYRRTDVIAWLEASERTSTADLAS